MDALTQIRAKINDYEGYGSESEIIRSDAKVRAYVGERLAALVERLGAQDPEAANALEPVIRRAAFANQRALTPLEAPNVHPLAQTGILQADLNLLDLADAAATVQPADLKDYVAKVSAAFDARDAALMELSRQP